MIRVNITLESVPMPEQPENSQALERKLATILSADVAEFSRLMGEDEEGTLRTFRGHKQVFESLVAMHRGRVFNTAGDAILAEFVSAVEAVRCATDIQAALRTLNDKLPANRQVRFRIGINLGDVMVQGSDLMGDGVNVAARLQTAAEPGGICISGSVHDQIRNKLSLSFLSLGERNFKNIQQPVRTFSISEAEGAGALPAARPSAGSGGGALKWLAVAAILLLAGGGYWAYTANQREKAEHRASAAAVSTQPAAATPSPSSGMSAAATPASNPEPPAATTTPEPTANPPASSPPVTAANANAAPVRPHPPSKLANAAPAVSTAFDGNYSGPVCFAETKMEPHRCFKTNGKIANSKISGQWFMGHEKKIVMLLTGNVTRTGDVTIEMEMHKETPDGERLASISLQGTLHDGTIKSSGTFRNGRPATLNWLKDTE
jgi:class 3 adenylate cyclase